MKNLTMIEAPKMVTSKKKSGWIILICLTLFLCFQNPSYALGGKAHCAVWRGTTLCRIKPHGIKHDIRDKDDGPLENDIIFDESSDAPNVSIKGPRMDFPAYCSLSIRKTEIDLSGEAALAIKNPGDKEISGILFLCLPGLDNEKVLNTKLYSVGVRHYFKGTLNPKLNTFICSDIGVDLSHYSGEENDYRCDPLENFELVIDGKTVMGNFRSQALVNSHKPSWYRTLFCLERQANLSEEDQKNWDSLLAEPAPQLKTKSTHAFINPYGEAAIYFR